MRVFAKVTEEKGVEEVLVKQDLGIVIVHNGKEYFISEDNHGALLIRTALGNNQLILKPKAANSAELDSE